MEERAWEWTGFQWAWELLLAPLARIHHAVDIPKWKQSYTIPPPTRLCTRTMARNHDCENNVRLTSGHKNLGIRSYRDFEV